jgi:hypothetical protein
MKVGKHFLQNENWRKMKVGKHFLQHEFAGTFCRMKIGAKRKLADTFYSINLQALFAE